MLRNGVLLNGSPPSSSGSAGKNAALSNQKHMQRARKEHHYLPPSLTSGHKATQKHRLLLVTASLLTNTAVWTLVTHGVCHRLHYTS